MIELLGICKDVVCVFFALLVCSIFSRRGLRVYVILRTCKIQQVLVSCVELQVDELDMSWRGLSRLMINVF